MLRRALEENQEKKQQDLQEEEQTENSCLIPQDNISRFESYAATA